MSLAEAIMGSILSSRLGSMERGMPRTFGKAFNSQGLSTSPDLSEHSLHRPLAEASA